MSEKWIKQQFRELETKARAKKLTMFKACVLAEMEPSMWFHWKAERYSPRMTSFQRLHDAVDRYKIKMPAENSK